jgi:hypothetical protein
MAGHDAEVPIHQINSLTPQGRLVSGGTAKDPLVHLAIQADRSAASFSREQSPPLTGTAFRKSYPGRWRRRCCLSNRNISSKLENFSLLGDDEASRVALLDIWCHCLRDDRPQAAVQ